MRRSINGIFTSIENKNQTQSHHVVSPNLLITSNRIKNINNVNELAFAKIYFVDGKLIDKQNINQQKKTLNLENLSTGIYFLEINTNTTKETFKIVKE